MDRYDWEWGRGYSGRRGSPYGRDYGWSGGRWSPEQRGPRSSFERYARGGYDRYGVRGTGGYGGGYRFSYPGARSGSRGPYGRQEPWEAGPPGGYGAQWGRAYGGPDAMRWRGPSTASSRYHAGAYDFDAFAPARATPYEREDLSAYYDDQVDADFGEYWDEEELDDDGVRDSVWHSLREDGFIDADSIQIEVKDRVVTLRGEVNDYMEARYAWDDAWDAQGVRGVISKLTVKGGGRLEAPPGATHTAGEDSTASRSPSSATRKSSGGKRG